MSFKIKIAIRTEKYIFYLYMQIRKLSIIFLTKKEVSINYYNMKNIFISAIIVLSILFISIFLDEHLKYNECENPLSFGDNTNLCSFCFDTGLTDYRGIIFNLFLTSLSIYYYFSIPSAPIKLLFKPPKLNIPF